MPKKTVVILIRIYQHAISPFFGQCCRFSPSCSQYTIEAIEKKGFFKGFSMGVWRILRCNPFNNKTGYDPVDK
ncbi:MAG: membrane protein insertion efficiency factor YidD [bacterium]